MSSSPNLLRSSSSSSEVARGGAEQHGHGEVKRGRQPRGGIHWRKDYGWDQDQDLELDESQAGRFSLLLFPVDQLSEFMPFEYGWRTYQGRVSLALCSTTCFDDLEPCFGVMSILPLEVFMVNAFKERSISFNLFLASSSSKSPAVLNFGGWMVKLMCRSHNHELAKLLVGHPYTGRLTKDEKTIIADMTKSMVKPRNILLTLKEHNVNSCKKIKQIYNARSAYRSSIRGRSDTEMQHLMKLLERDQYIHWHRLKDENVVRDIFWCHPDAVKLCNACNLVFLIDSTYKTNKYKFPLLDFVGVTPTGMTFFVDFAYLEGERVNNVVWALEWFRGFFLRHDALPGVIVTDRDLTLMNAMKIVFHECTNLLCRFHIDKNVKAKCKSLIGQKNAWEYVMDAWGSLVDCPS
ncbi:Protein FAR1-RELATED SEQUENCE 5 [Glycine max]|nr:Protein FAR1-RELATED SEQUENCE 5 [Glycine max]